MSQQKSFCKTEGSSTNTAKSFFSLGVDWEDFGQVSFKNRHGFVPKPFGSDIERQTNILLDLLDETDVTATFFILGILAKHRPLLVREICARGHEIALHGNYHDNLMRLSRKEIFEDISDALKLVTDIISKDVYGYRAPYFSIYRGNLFILEVLAELGLRYDSSIFPVETLGRGIGGFDPNDQLYQLKNGLEIVELPLAIAYLGKRRIPIAGGGYMRVMPSWLISLFFQRLALRGACATLYCHPYELDSTRVDWTPQYVDYKHLAYSKRNAWISNFKVNLFRRSLYPKMKRVFLSHNFTTCIKRTDYVKKRNSPRLLEY